jgi:PAS domain-containing protein
MAAPVQRSGLDAASSVDLEREVRNSERQRAVGEPGAADQQLHHLLAHSPAVLYVLNIECEKVVPILVSENIERLLGVTVAKSMTYKWWLDSLHPEDRDRAVVVMN